MEEKSLLDTVSTWYTFGLSISILFALWLMGSWHMVDEVGVLFTILIALVATAACTLCFLIGPIFILAIKFVVLLVSMLVGVFMVLVFWYSPELGLSQIIQEASSQYNISPWWVLISWIIGPIDTFLVLNSGLFD